MIICYSIPGFYARVVVLSHEDQSSPTMHDSQKACLIELRENTSNDHLHDGDDLTENTFNVYLHSAEYMKCVPDPIVYHPIFSP